MSCRHYLSHYLFGLGTGIHTYRVKHSSQSHLLHKILLNHSADCSCRGAQVKPMFTEGSLALCRSRACHLVAQ